MCKGGRQSDVKAGGAGAPLMRKAASGGRPDVKIDRDQLVLMDHEEGNKRFLTE